MDGHSVREGGSGKNLSFLNSINRRCRYESKGNIGLHRVQTAQLQHNEEQEEYARQTWDEQVLQILQEAYSPQGNQVIDLSHKFRLQTVQPKGMKLHGWKQCR